MLRFWIRVGIYFISFLFCLYGLDALDFNRFLKKNKPAKGQILYLLISFAMAYLVGNFIMSLIYYFY